MLQRMLFYLIGIAAILVSCQGTDTQLLGFSIHHGYPADTEPECRTYVGLPYTTVWNCCIDTFWELDLPIAAAQEGMVRSRKMEGEGVSWALCVKLEEKEGSVEVMAFLEVRRETEWESHHIDQVIDQALGLDEEDDEASTDEIRKERDRIRIRRVTERVTRFFPLLDDRVMDRGGQIL